LYKFLFAFLHSTNNLRHCTHTISAPRTDSQHHLGAHNAAYEDTKQMPVLRPGHKDVPQADQVELHDQGVEAGIVGELLALAAASSGFIQDIALVIRDTEVGVTTADQVAGIASELRDGIELRSGEDDAGHEPGGGDFAQEDDEDGPQLPDAKVTHHIRDDIATRRYWCRRWRSHPLVQIILHLIGQDVGGSGLSTSGWRRIDHCSSGGSLVEHSANDQGVKNECINLFVFIISFISIPPLYLPTLPIDIN